MVAQNSTGLVAAEGVPPAERVRLLEEHRAKKVEKRADDTHRQARAYMAHNRGEGTYVAPLVRVPCTVPGYEHLTIVYNIGLPYRRLRSLPPLEERGDDESDADFDERYFEWTALMPAWLTLFVVRIEGWDLLDLDGTPLPAPTKEDARGYELIAQQNERLLNFLAFEGYEKALTIHVGEAGARSSKPSNRGKGRVNALDGKQGVEA